jgi:hypothetical protein
MQVSISGNSPCTSVSNAANAFGTDVFVSSWANRSYSATALAALGMAIFNSIPLSVWLTIEVLHVLEGHGIVEGLQEPRKLFFEDGQKVKQEFAIVIDTREQFWEINAGCLRRTVCFVHCSLGFLLSLSQSAS